VRQSADEVTVSMSLKDDFEYSAAPSKFRRGFTGVEATTYVTLKAGRAALDARMVLKNPQPKPIQYEYWTCSDARAGIGPEKIQGDRRRRNHRRRSMPTARLPGRPICPAATRL